MFRLPQGHALINRLGFNNGVLPRRVPIFVKIAPDLDQAQIDAIAAALKRHGMDGVVATNTTTSRDAVKGLPLAEEAGGLSGAPLLDASKTPSARSARAPTWCRSARV